jgi:hypothetical protein
MERSGHETCENIGQVYDASAISYVSPQSASPPVIGGIMYSEYPASDWHQIEHSRQPEVVQNRNMLKYVIVYIYKMAADEVAYVYLKMQQVVKY